jgi:hypothetical protein
MVQAGAFSADQLAALGAAQALGLTTAQIATLDAPQVVALNAAGFNALNSDQIQALDANDIVALRTAQVGALSAATIANLSALQVASFSTAQVRALKATQIAALTSDQIAALTVAELSAFTMVQAGAFSADQLSAMADEQRAALLTSPLILDLDGNGVRTRDVAAGVRFDLLADGHQVATGWVGQGDGLLALDRNHDGAIGDGGELFGTSTATAGGGKARDGFAALAGLDANGDGVVDRHDAQFGDLRVWVDANADGVSQGDELRTLDALGIASLAVGASATSELDNGNWIGLRSSYTSTDGHVGQVADVWFRAERAAPASTQVGTPVSTQVSALAQALGGYAQAQADQAGLPAAVRAEAVGWP